MKIKALVPAPLNRALEHRTMSRRSLMTGLGLGAAAALTGCSATGFAASATPDSQLETNLNVYSWGDYSDPSILDRFIAETDVNVQLDAFASNEELIAKLGAARGTSGYDVVVPTRTYQDLFVANKLLEPLDLDRIPNAMNLAPEFAETLADPENSYLVCKNWGTTGFAYDTTVINRELSSWQDFIDAMQNEASGKTSLLDDAGEIAFTVLAAHGQDPLTEDPAIIAETSEFLVTEVAPHIRAFNSTPGSYIIQRSMALVHAYNGDARRAFLDAEDSSRWKWVYPTPTANRWMDTWAIPTGAQNIDAAYAFINFMLDPQNAIADVDYIGYSTGLKGQGELAVEEGFDLVEMLYPPQATLDALVQIELNDATEQWIATLDRMKASAGA